MIPTKTITNTANKIFPAIALVAGVDRIFDMGRTTVNITGDAACTMVVSNLESKKDARRAKAGK